MSPTNEKLAQQLHRVPQQLVLLMTGKRRTVELQRLREKWGIPLDGRSADLFDVLKSVADFFARYGELLDLLVNQPDGDSEDPLSVQLLRARIRKLTADAEMARLRIAQKEQTLVDRATIRGVLQSVAGRINSACDRAQRKWGPDGFEFFRDLVEGIRSDIATTLADDDQTDAQSSGDAALIAKPE
jgi:phage terminase Nu1 subunit (DNA packaging protein)